MLQKYEKPRENGNLLPVFREHFKTTSKIVKDKSNRVGLHAKIAESLPVFCKDSTTSRRYGIIRDPKYPKRIGSALPLLVSLGYDDTTNTIRFSSPYMLRLIQTLYNVKVRQSKLNLNKITEPAKFLISEHTDIIYTSIAKERNKRAVEIVFAIVTMIEQSTDENVCITVLWHLLLFLRLS